MTEAIVHARRPSRRQSALGLFLALLLFSLAVLTGPVLRLSNLDQQLYSVGQLNFFATDWPAFLGSFGLSPQACSDYLRINFAADGTVSRLICTAYEPADDPGDSQVTVVQIVYQPEQQLIAVQRRSLRPTAVQADPAAVLAGKSRLSRLLFALEKPDWASQLAAFPYAWIGLACDGDDSLGTPPGDTFLIAADGGLRLAEASELPLPTGTVLALYGQNQPQGPSEQINYYYLASRTIVAP